jgi:hypothetical protein
VALTPEERPRISGRMKNALVADLVMKDLDQAKDRLLTEPLNEPSDWTFHLARQLKVSETSDLGDIRETLKMLVLAIDPLLRTWSLPLTVDDCRPLAQEVTKGLRAIEIYATLLAGPGDWRRGKIPEATTIAALPMHLRPLLEKGLASELSRVFTSWVTWDVRQLRERWIEAVKAAEAEKVADAIAERRERKRPTPSEIAARRADNAGSTFIPPGRT